MGLAQPTESDAGSLMTRPLPIEEPDDDDEQERLNAQRAKRRARLLADEGVSGWYVRADDLSPQTQARR